MGYKQIPCSICGCYKEQCRGAPKPFLYSPHTDRGKLYKSGGRCVNDTLENPIQKCEICGHGRPLHPGGPCSVGGNPSLCGCDGFVIDGHEDKGQCRTWLESPGYGTAAYRGTIRCNLQQGHIGACNGA